MESCSSSDDMTYRNSSSLRSGSNVGGSSSGSVNGDNNSRRYGINIAASSLIHSPLTALLEYSGILGERGGIVSSSSAQERQQLSPDQQEFTIRIIGAAEHHHQSHSEQSLSSAATSDVEGQALEGNVNFVNSESVVDEASGIGSESSSPSSSASSSSSSSSSSYQRYDIHNFARWIEQVLPFSLLLLLVFVRQHLQGFCVTSWIAAVLFKSNDIVKKQTALKGERKNLVLIGITIAFMLHVTTTYWWYRNDDLLYPLVLLPPKTIPPFWNAVFIIVVNDIMVRQAAMIFKCTLLMYYKNSRGHNYRKQGQMLTLVEYSVLVYRAFLPAPVWYRFFLNKEYGSFFSSLITGLYLTIKLTSVLGKVQLFFAALRALSRKEMHYGSYATSEQVNAAGDLCAICQEKMHIPILLQCKHIFCEDCVSEWFERERTCPLCRALVKPADIKSYSDGSTSLFFQLF